MTVQEYVDTLLAGEVVPLDDAPRLSLDEHIRVGEILAAKGKEVCFKTEVVVPEIKGPLGLYQSYPRPYKRLVGYVAARQQKGD